MTRSLVITADDLGRDPGTTDTILDLVRDGLVTATTLITVAPHAARAAVGIGATGVVPHLHTTLTRDRGVAWHPLSSASDGGTSSLTDADGLLLDDAAALGARGETDDVIAELDAQLTWMRDHGLDPAACDSHAGTLYGLHGRSWLAEALQWCARNGLAFRLPRDPAPYFGGGLPPEFEAAHAQAVAFADRLGVGIPQAIITNARDAHELDDYETLLADLVARAAELSDGTSELFLHPSAAGAVPGAAGVAREWEARLLRDERWQSALKAEDIRLVPAW